MLILLYRPEYTRQWGSRSYYNSVSLNLLGTESSTELVKAILEGGGIVPEIRDKIHGNRVQTGPKNTGS